MNKTFGFTGAVLPILPDDAAEVQHQLDIRKQETIHLMHQLLEEGARRYGVALGLTDEQIR